MKPHVSATQLAMMAKCPVQWEFRYAKGIKAAPGVAQTTGKATHAGIEANMRAKLVTGSPLELETVQTLAADAVTRLWAEEPPTLDDEEVERGAAKVRGEAIDKAVALAGLHHREVAPLIEPVAVEEQFIVPMAGYTHDLMGYMDIVTPTHIRDTKTASKSPAEDTAHRSLQLTVYSFTDPAKRLALDHLVATKAPKYVMQETTRTEADRERLMRRLEVVERVIESGAFAPTDPANWWCSRRFCGYWSICKHGGG
jgi:CRISPR/Cas system-associated exonuclease Cas4 (RecB family)